MTEGSLLEKSCREFMELLSSKAPAPGGGSAAALGAAIGVGLVNMVINLTMDKPKYAADAEELRTMLTAGTALQRELADLVDADAKAFLPLSKAYGLPAVTEEEKKQKAAALSRAAVEATEVPLSIAEKTFAAVLLCRRAAEIGARLALSDIGCAAAFLEAGIAAAAYNVNVNLPLIQDQCFAARVAARMKKISADAALSSARSKELADERSGVV